MHPSIEILGQTRTLMSKLVGRLTPEQWLTIPDGHDNNIAWNIGHIIGVQQSLIYRLSGVPQYTSKEFFRMYKPNSSPADWTQQPDTDELQTMLLEHVELLRADYSAEKFQQYTTYTTATKFTLTSLDEALAFNHFHEGLHLGTILSIINHLRSD